MNLRQKAKKLKQENDYLRSVANAMALQMCIDHERINSKVIPVAASTVVTEKDFKEGLTEDMIREHLMGLIIKSEEGKQCVAFERRIINDRLGTGRYEYTAYLKAIKQSMEE